MRAADDAVNEALIVANEGRIERILAYGVGDGHGGQLSVDEERMLENVSFSSGF